MATRTPRKVPAKKVAANGTKRQYITAQHRADIAKITATMYELADDHGFCDLFHTTIKELNESLVVKIDAPPATVEVEFSVTLHLVAETEVDNDSFSYNARRLVGASKFETDIRNALGSITAVSRVADDLELNI